MEALIDNGEDWMEPLSDFRDMLQENRNKRELRDNRRRGSYKEGEDIWGPYIEEHRAEMLKTLLETQKEVQKSEPDLVLVNYQELVAIQVTWHRDSLFSFSVADIYNEVYGTELTQSDFNDQAVFEKEILMEVCDNETDFNLISELLEIQKTKFIMVNNYGLQSDLETHIERHTRNQRKDVH
jgi:DNA sulfur modification protein DndC